MNTTTKNRAYGYKIVAMPHDAATHELRKRWGEPAIYLSDGGNGRCAAVRDDGCWLAVQWSPAKGKQGWKSQAWHFPALHEAMRDLPPLSGEATTAPMKGAKP